MAPFAVPPHIFTPSSVSLHPASWSEAILAQMEPRRLWKQKELEVAGKKWTPKFVQ